MTDFLPDIFYQDEQLSTRPDRSGIPGEQRLWQRVIHQLLIDAQGKAGGIKGEEKLNVQHCAIRWFIKGGRDFHMVCDLAGINPKWVRENAMKLLRQKDLIE